jgi:hypothetical protein
VRKERPGKKKGGQISVERWVQRKSVEKKTAMFLSSIPDRINRPRSGGKSIKEHHKEITRTRDSPRYDGVAKTTYSPVRHYQRPGSKSRGVNERSDKCDCESIEHEFSDTLVYVGSS